MSRVRLKQLAQDGATDGEVAKWNNTAGVWEAGTAASGGISTGTAAARPASPADGTFYYATDTQALSYYDVDTWEDVGILVDDVTIEIDGTSGKLQLKTTGTPTGSLYLRDDMQWTAPPGGGGADAVPACFRVSGSSNILNTSDSQMVFDTTDVSNANYSLTTGTVTVTAAGTYFISYSIPMNEDGTAGATRSRGYSWVEDDGTPIPQSYNQGYLREASGGGGTSSGFVAVLGAGSEIELYARTQNNTDVSSETGQAQLSIFKLGTG